ncbi:UBX domain-containing protein 10 [Vanrija albida]|uniref:UBX domain-containing protein 10 n=1 Tax=Vanrija albida TaxID=181172 RepID=A0ABR3Q2Q9_9TREE
MASLTPSQAEALDQLHAIAASETDAARARDERVLREHNWDVQRAINSIFSNQDRSGPSSRASGSKATTEGSAHDEKEADDGDLSLGSYGRRITPGAGLGRAGARPRARPGAAGLSLWETFVWPFSLIASLLTGTWYFFIRTFVPLSLLPHLPRFLLPPPSRAPPSGPRDPTTAALRFVRELEALTGGSASAGTLPDLWVGPYREFLSEVRKQGKVGLVVLVSSEHEDDEEFKRDVLADPEFVRTLKEHDIMIWAADIGSREGYMVSQTLLTTTYPALTFASLLPAQNSSTPRLTILTTLQGEPSTSTSTSTIIQTITTSVLPRTNAFLARLRRDRFALEEARHLREEQDRALREAERKDRERLQAARAQAELERVQRERAEREAELQAKALADRRQWRRYARKHLLPAAAGPMRVAVRTPLNAERNIRNFAPGESTLPLFIYTETLLIPPDDDPAEDPDTPPEGYVHAWGFRLVTSFPRKEIELLEGGAEDAWATVKGAGGALFAEKIPGGDWGDAEAKALKGEESDEEVVSDDE